MTKAGWKTKAGVALGIVLIVALTMKDVYDLIFPQEGVKFYREKPWLLAACLLVGMAGGGVWCLWAKIRKRAPGNYSTTDVKPV